MSEIQVLSSTFKERGNPVKYYHVTYDQICMFMFSCLSSFISSSGHWCGFGIVVLVVLHLTAAAVEIQEEQRCGAVHNMINMTEQQQLEDTVSCIS